MSPPTTILPPGAAVALGEQIRVRRIALGMSRSQLVIAAGCSLTFLENVEAGAGPRRSAVIPQVLDALTKAEAANAA
jgi:predicted transcriptional regulator